MCLFLWLSEMLYVHFLALLLSRENKAGKLMILLALMMMMIGLLFY